MAIDWSKPGSVTPATVAQEITRRAKEKGADPEALLQSQIDHLGKLAGQISHVARTGDERFLAHLEAQFKLARFSTEAEAYLEAKAWAEALLEVLGDLAEAAIAAAGKAGIALLKGALSEGLGK